VRDNTVSTSHLLVDDSIIFKTGFDVFNASKPKCLVKCLPDLGL